MGTSGIVEPKSMQALRESIRLEIRQLAANGAKQLLLTPGHYGEDFVASHLELAKIPVVQCANFVGDSLDDAAEFGFEQVLLVGHIGKFVKLAGGIMNTHSRWADCRVELISAHAALHGADRKNNRGADAGGHDRRLPGSFGKLRLAAESSGNAGGQSPVACQPPGWAAPIRQGWFFTASSRERCLSPNRRGKS